jgi:hypothetical protein
MTDLYKIAEEIGKLKRYQQIYFEDGHNGSLWFDTFPAKLNIMPYRRGGRLRSGEMHQATQFVVGFSWGEADVDMGTYKTARGAVKRAMELARWSDDDIREAFGAWIHGK